MMIGLVIYNKETGETNTLEYKDLDKVRKTIRKCKHSKKVVIISQYGYERESDYIYANDIWF